jgi:hypothetical protein
VTKVLSVDPGTHCMGWGLFEEELRNCGLARSKAKKLGFSIQELVSQLPTSADLVVVELPRIYPYQRRIRVNDLLDLAAAAGACAAVGPLQFVYPATWKGQTPKDISHGRIRAALKPQELLVLERSLEGIPDSLHHNVLDAVGIGQWRRGEGDV